MRYRSLAVLLGASACAFAGFSVSAQTLLGPTPYLCFGDSPFSGHSFGYFYLETFEDHLFDVPGVSANQGGVTSVDFGPLIHDSVDCDDGVIDGSGLQGDSFYSGIPDIVFSFDVAVLGSLPTHAGIVWTDGGFGATIIFEAYDAAGVSIGTVTGQHANEDYDGATDEDRFYGVIYPQGIGSIRIRHDYGGIEVDHLQYGGNAPSCPADFNHDGLVEDADFLVFVASYNILDCADPLMTPGCPADLNRDGFVDDADFILFVAAYNELLCP